MRIKIKTEGRSFTIPIPTFLLTSHHLLAFGYWVTKKTSGKYSSGPMPDLDEAQLKKLCMELRRIKKQYGSYELVHVQSAEREIVRIIL